MSVFQLNIIVKKGKKIPDVGILKNIEQNSEPQVTKNYIVYYFQGQIADETKLIHEIKQLLSKKQVNGLWAVHQKDPKKPNTWTYIKDKDGKIMIGKNSITRETI